LFKDYKTMLCAQVIECWCGLSKHEVYTTYELNDSSSVMQLPNLVEKSSVQLESLMYGSGGDSELTQASSCSQASFMPYDAEVSGGSSLDQIQDAAPTDTSRAESILFHPRFAAGQVFTPELWGAMLGRMFYMPAIIELVEALVIPHRRGQVAAIWQIRVPSFFCSLTFSELLSTMVLGGWDSHQEMTPDTPSAELQDMGPAVPLALYRPRDDFGPNSTAHAKNEDMAQGTGGHNFNILGPPPGTKLRSGDWVMVLASRQFGLRAHSLGLLRGSGTEAPDLDESSEASEAPANSTSRRSSRSNSNCGADGHSDRMHGVRSGPSSEYQPTALHPPSSPPPTMGNTRSLPQGGTAVRRHSFTNTSRRPLCTR
jgi:hypothetical protein